MDEPSYLALHRSGALPGRAAAASALLRECAVCPRRCRVDRLAGDFGECGIGTAAIVASAGPHHGEEGVLRGRGGSGTIFFAGCNLHCAFCQNEEISHAGALLGSGRTGEALGPNALAAIMVGLQEAGCHNINLVTPSHVVPQILAALPPAVDSGLHLPLVYNTSGYDAVETLRLLDGVVDVYMPDFKVWEPDVAEAVLTARDYPDVARAAIAEMHHQVGDLVTDVHGIARRGLLVRHLVMPEMTDDSRQIMRWLATLSPDTAVNVMGQYRPAGRVMRERGRWPMFERAVTRQEHRAALETARAAGLTRLLGD